MKAVQTIKMIYLIVKASDLMRKEIIEAMDNIINHMVMTNTIRMEEEIMIILNLFQKIIMLLK
jgi:hypothetical protein